MFNARAASLVLSLSLLSAVSGPAFAQNGNGAQQSQPNSIVGSWEMQERLQDGAIMHQFDQYGTDGTWRQTAINVGGPSNGTRTQTWGNYSVQAMGNNVYRIMFRTTGFAPMQVCTQGVGLYATHQAANLRQHLHPRRPQSSPLERSPGIDHRARCPNPARSGRPAAPDQNECRRPTHPKRQ